jgi:GrpB-like predicted nucleotidyltransferase (UPF0157 family)
MEERKKSVEELSDEERAALFPIVLNEYNPNWREWFLEEKTRIEGLLSAGNIGGMTDIGSESGLAGVGGMTSTADLGAIENVVKVTDIGSESGLAGVGGMTNAADLGAIENVVKITDIGSKSELAGVGGMTNAADLEAIENAVKVTRIGNTSEQDLTGSIASITHIGSTAVLGLTAKPTVDILLEIPNGTDLKRFKAAFPKSEYVRLDRQTTPTDDIMIFLKGYTAEGFADRVFHIHVRYKGDWDEVCFRDYLILYPKIAAEYAELKRKLKDEYEYDRDGYTNAKGEFIKRTTELAKRER